EESHEYTETYSSLRSELTPLEQFLASLNLTVVWIFDLHPTRTAIIGDIRTVFPLCNDALKVEFTRLRVQTRPVVPNNRGTEVAISFDRSVSGVAPFDEEAAARASLHRSAIAGRTHRKTVRPMKHQLFELRAALLIKTYDLAIENGFITAQVSCDRGAQFMERFVFVTAAGDKATSSRFNISERPKPIELDFVKPVGMVERLRAPCRTHRFEVQRQHAERLHGEPVKRSAALVG